MTSVFSPVRRIQTMLDVEVALAEALAETGVIPGTSVAPIRKAARAELYDLASIEAESMLAGNPLIPLVRHLTRAVAAEDPAAAGHVHWGATSQDVMDTALVLALREAGAEIASTLGRAADAAALLADRHAATPIAGRTWLQQATPTTFGAKAMVWMHGLDRARAQLLAALDAARDLQFGGATGTLSTLGDAGPLVTAGLAAKLGLRAPDAAWHSERSRVAGVACALGIACGTLGKIGRDLALLSQTEIAEAAEAAAPGRGGSSSMPHKHNPVASVRAVAAAVRAPGLVATMLSAMPQEHERAIGGWQAEWETLPELVTLAADASAAIADALAHLSVDEARMRANLDAAGGVARAEGLMAALAPRIGRIEAARLVEATVREAVASGRALAEVANADHAICRYLERAAIDAALDPDALTATARDIVRRSLQHRDLGRQETHNG